MARMRIEPAAWWWLVTLVGICLLPWHMQQDGLGPSALLAISADDPDVASALAQALWHKRFWFWPVVIAPIIALPALLPGIARERRAIILGVAGGVGLAAIIAQGWLI